MENNEISVDQNVVYDWSEFKTRLKAKFDMSIMEWCEDRKVVYSSLNGLRYNMWTPEQGYGPAALRIIKLALKDELIIPLDKKAA